MKIGARHVIVIAFFSAAAYFLHSWVNSGTGISTASQTSSTPAHSPAPSAVTESSLDKGNAVVDEITELVKSEIPLKIRAEAIHLAVQRAISAGKVIAAAEALSAVEFCPGKKYAFEWLMALCNYDDGLKLIPIIAEQFEGEESRTMMAHWSSTVACRPPSKAQQIVREVVAMTSGSSLAAMATARGLGSSLARNNYDLGGCLKIASELGDLSGEVTTQFLHLYSERSGLECLKEFMDLIPDGTSLSFLSNMVISRAVNQYPRESLEFLTRDGLGDAKNVELAISVWLRDSPLEATRWIVKQRPSKMKSVMAAAVVTHLRNKDNPDALAIQLWEEQARQNDH